MKRLRTWFTSGLAGSLNLFRLACLGASPGGAPPATQVAFWSGQSLRARRLWQNLSRYRSARRETSRRLAALSQTLARENAQTEQQFVELARTLRSLYSTATELAGLVSHGAGALRHALAESRIAGPEGLAARSLAQLNTSLEDAADLLRQLETIGSGLERLQTQIGSIQRIGLFLESSGFSFAVESARTPECHQAFGAFVEELRGLAGRISELGENVVRQIQSARLSHAGGLKAMVSNLGEMHKLAQGLETTASATATAAQGLLDSSCAALQRAEEHTRQIAREANEAVFHLQFGDLIRQKLEHVALALGEAERLGSASKPAKDFGATAAAVDCVLAIQEGQLQAVREEVLAAHAKLSAAFEQIGEGTGRLAEILQPWHGTAVGAGADPLAALGEDLRRVEQLHGQGAEVRRRAGEVAAQTGAASTRLAEHVQGIKSINSDMHLQALNAIIKTVALGGQGATLEVLSMQVEWLFRESNQEVQAIVETLNAILRHAQDTAPGGEPGQAGAAAAAMELKLQAGLQQVQQAYEAVKGASAEASRLVDQQQRLLAQSRVALQFLVSFAEGLAVQLQDLASLRQLLARTKTATAPSAAAAEVLDQRYTMEAERAIHQRISQDAAASSRAPKAAADGQGPQPLSFSSAGAEGQNPEVPGLGLAEAVPSPASAAPTAPVQAAGASCSEEPQPSGAQVSAPMGSPLTLEPRPSAADPGLGDNVELF